MTSTDDALVQSKNFDAMHLMKQDKIVTDGKVLLITDTSAAWKFMRDSLTSREQSQLEEQDSDKKTYRLHALSSYLEDDRSNVHEYVVNPHRQPVRTCDIEHLRFRYVFKPARSSYCYYCKPEDCKHGMLHGCRVCEHSYHEDCLRARGRCKDELSMEAISGSISLIGWSCPDCENLFGLLSDQERDKVMDIFETVSGEDGVIGIQEFIEMQKEDYRKLLNSEMPSYRERLERELFGKIDRDSTGAVEWWEFMPHMAIRMLGRRSAKELLLLLTPREVATFKRYFLAIDTDGTGAVSQSQAKKAYTEWYTSLVKLRTGETVDKSWYRGELDFDYECGPTMSTYGRYISWDEYLQQCALNILAARPNTVYQKPFIPPMPTCLYEKRSTASYDYDDIAPVDEFGEKCDDVTLFIKSKLARNAKERAIEQQKEVEKLGH